MNQRLQFVLASMVMLTACEPRLPVGVEEARTPTWWQGDLVELDGKAVASGIKIEIQSGASAHGFDSQEAVQFELQTGCRGAGFVDETGQVRAVETLRPCDEADVARMNRLTSLVGHEDPRQRVRLQWNDDQEATLASVAGSARFKNSIGQ